MSGLRERDREVLTEMLACSGDERWLRPMDIGGCDGSDDSYRMAKLARLGLAERARRASIANELGGGRGSNVYRLTAEGVTVARAQQESAS